MSSLWTPGGEVPVDRSGDPRGSAADPGDPGSAPAADADALGGEAEPTTEEVEAARAQLQEILLSTPAVEVVAQHVVGIYELATLHLQQPEPDLAAARLAIDALDGVVSRVGDRLGPVADQLQQVIPQLKMLVVQLSAE